MRELTKTEIEAVAGGISILAIISLAKTLYDIGSAIYNYFNSDNGGGTEP